MKEAATGSSKGKAVAKGSDNADKKKFEVKKVHTDLLFTATHILTGYSQVERRCPVGLGYRRRQLCHLPKPHHGLVYAETTPQSSLILQADRPTK